MPRSLPRLLACLLLLAATSAIAGAREDIQACMQRLLALRSYHASMHIGGARPMTNQVDFVAPDRYRMTLPMGTQTIVGDSLLMDVRGMHMKVPMPKGTLTRWRDPGNLEKNMATMSAQSLGAETVDGQPARKYRITNTQPRPSESLLWIGADGYPLQIQVAGDTPSTIRYSRFNDPGIRIDVP